jgi:hypothetical protein
MTIIAEITQSEQMDLSNTHYGCYRIYDRSNNRKICDYIYKLDALIDATKMLKNGKNVGIAFAWYHEIFKNFDRSQLGKQSLTQLYLQRAQQIRDKYDYVLLKYSGGSDSHNILMTYLKNGIKLDGVMVQWPFKVMETKLHTPSFIREGWNEMSEWDFVIKPDLEWIRDNHPEIDIFLVDWSEDLLSLDQVKTIFNDDFMKTGNHFWGSAASWPRNSKYPPEIIKMQDEGKKVGIVEGIEKPNLQIRSENLNRVYIQFVDTPIQQNRSPNGEGVELFYWTPDMPLLTFEMAYRMAKYYELTPENRHWIRANIRNTPTKEFHDIVTKRNNVAKLVCYPYWDFNRFQVDKSPNTVKYRNIFMSGKASDWVLYAHEDFDYAVQATRYLLTSYYDLIDDRWLRFDPKGKPIGLFPTGGPDYFLTDIAEQKFTD